MYDILYCENKAYGELHPIKNSCSNWSLCSILLQPTMLQKFVLSFPVPNVSTHFLF